MPYWEVSFHKNTRYENGSCYEQTDVTLSIQEMTDVDLEAGRMMERNSIEESFDREEEEFDDEPRVRVVVPKKVNYKNFKETLNSTILGQSVVIEDVTKKLMRREFVLSTDKKKPITLFWAGPTGVGKTETALQIASNLSLPLVRLDMSEYMEFHNVSRLIGSPPGYVGYNQPGVLQEYAGQSCVILIDEIEKAHPDVLNMFLQVMDYGTLTDGRNKQLDLSKALLIMTSNIGAAEMNQARIGFAETSPQEKVATVQAAMKNYFTPEFLNRINSIQVFDSLDEKLVQQIVDNKLSKVIGSVKEGYDIELSLSEELQKELIKKSYNPLMGARPIERAFETLILEPLSELVLSEDNRPKKVVLNIPGKKPNLI